MIRIPSPLPNPLLVPLPAWAATGYGLGYVMQDPDAIAYATARSLAAPQAERLDRFLLHLKAAGWNPAWMALGRSEFSALDGSTHHAVIGSDGALTGSFSAAASGLVFAGSTEVYQFANPAKSASLPSLAMYVMASTTAETSVAAVAVSGYYGNTAGVNRGPTLQLGASRASPDATGNIVGVDGTSAAGTLVFGNSGSRALWSNSHRLHGLLWSVNGVKPLSRDDTIATRPLYVITGASFQQASNSALANLWNNTDNLRLGRRGDGNSPLAGQISFALIAAQDITSAMHLALMEGLEKYSIAPASNPVIIAAIGDSMTDGVSGGVARRDSRSDQLVSQSSGWSQSLYWNEAQSGEPIDTQERFHATSMARLALLPSWDRWAMYWGGYNIGDTDWNNVTTRDAILQRYLDMAEDAAQRGVSSIHWAKLIGYDGDATTAQEIADHDDWNTKYEAGLAALQTAYPNVRILWYDHRINYPTQFDGDTRNAAYFVDSRHLSALGQQTLVADFVATYPNP